MNNSTSSGDVYALLNAHNIDISTLRVASSAASLSLMLNADEVAAAAATTTDDLTHLYNITQLNTISKHDNNQ